VSRLAFIFLVYRSDGLVETMFCVLSAMSAMGELKGRPGHFPLISGMCVSFIGVSHDISAKSLAEASAGTPSTFEMRRLIAEGV
jgi:hypothetical protein